MNLNEKLDYINSLELDKSAKAELSEVVAGKRNFCVFYFQDCDPRNYIRQDNFFPFSFEREREIIAQFQPLLDPDTPADQGFDPRSAYVRVQEYCINHPSIVNPTIELLQIIFGNWKEYRGGDYIPNPCSSCKRKVRPKVRLILTEAFKRIPQ